MLAVDEVSLIKEGPVRVKLRARDVAAFRGFVEIFIDGPCYEIKFVAERPTTKSQGPNNPQPKKPDDDNMTDDT